jgi:radical SAM superfamily enzyme YgiQ (UPF0313 family)
MLAELQALYDLGWRGSVFVVDDNFIGNQRNVKRFLRELIPWSQERTSSLGKQPLCKVLLFSWQ